MRTYGRLSAQQPDPVAYDLDMPSWALDGVSLTQGQTDPNGGVGAYLLTATGASPVAFSAGYALPVKTGAYYSMQTLPVDTTWVSYVIDYLGANGTPVCSDVISYDYTTGAYDTSGASYGATLTVTRNIQGWYQATMTLPRTFATGVIGTQLEYWPVGIQPPYTTYGGSAYAYQADYVMVTNIWVEIDTDATGFNDNVYLTTLAQVLALNLGESPFFANYGIPQQQTVVTQVYPDFYVAQTQTQFAPYFASLVIKRVQGSSPPIYTVAAVTHSGAVINKEIAL
ncbi:MAG: hypothetical protein ACYCOR_13560 [Acidobacteriaceae bacterium]